MMTSRTLVLCAVALSLGLHAALVPPAARWLERAREAPGRQDETTVRSEVVLPMADWIRVESNLPDLATEPPETAQEDPAEAAKRDLGYVRTTANQESLTAPQTPGFISDRNTLAASAAPAAGEEPLPTVDGEDEESRDVEDRRYRDGALVDESPNLAQPSEAPGIPNPVMRPVQPTPAIAAATSPPSPSAAATVHAPEIHEPLPPIPDAIPIPRPDPRPPEDPSQGDGEGVREVTSATPETPTREDDHEKLTEEESRPPDPSTLAQSVPPPGANGAPASPAPSSVDLPDRNVEAFQSETRKARLKGGAPEKGYAAYDAENTPIGRYRKEVSAAIERAWQSKMLANRDFMGFNMKIQVDFTVNRWGKAQNLRVRKRAKNAVITNLTLAAIIEAALPKMPARVLEELDGGDLPCFYNFRIH